MGPIWVGHSITVPTVREMGYMLTRVTSVYCECVCGLVMCCQHVCLSQDTCSDYDRIVPLVGALVGMCMCVCVGACECRHAHLLADVPDLSVHLIRL